MATSHPETIANINRMRRSAALHRYRRKMARCERLLISARYLILEMLGTGRTLSDNRLLTEIEEEIGRK